MVCCMMDRVWGRGTDVGRLVGRGQVVAPWPPGGRLVRRDHVRGRPHLASRRPALVAGVERRLLGRDNLWREGRAVGDPVAVPELPVLPLGQRAAEAELGAARREGGAAVAPLDPLRPAMFAMFAMFAEIIWTQRQVATSTTSKKSMRH